VKVVWMGEVRRVSMWLGNPWLSVNVIACLDQSKYIVAAIGAGTECTPVPSQVNNGPPRPFSVIPRFGRLIRDLILSIHAY
jgi:hypothetical protein